MPPIDNETVFDQDRLTEKGKLSWPREIRARLQEYPNNEKRSPVVHFIFSDVKKLDQALPALTK